MSTFRFYPSPGESEFVEYAPQVSSPEKRPIRRELKIIVPDGFELTEDKLRHALESIVNTHRPGDSIYELRAMGLDYTGMSGYLTPPGPIFINVKDIVGTESKLGWSGLVQGIGRSDAYARPQPLPTVLYHAQQIIDMNQDDRNNVLHGIELILGMGKFFVDSDGRRRILTLKALSELGCDVVIYGMKVGELV